MVAETSCSVDNHGISGCEYLGRCLCVCAYVCVIRSSQQNCVSCDIAATVGDADTYVASQMMSPHRRWLHASNSLRQDGFDTICDKSEVMGSLETLSRPKTVWAGHTVLVLQGTHCLQLLSHTVSASCPAPHFSSTCQKNSWCSQSTVASCAAWLFVYYYCLLACFNMHGQTKVLSYTVSHAGRIDRRQCGTTYQARRREPRHLLFLVRHFH